METIRADVSWCSLQCRPEVCAILFAQRQRACHDTLFIEPLGTNPHCTQSLLLGTFFWGGGRLRLLFQFNSSTAKKCTKANEDDKTNGWTRHRGTQREREWVRDREKYSLILWFLCPPQAQRCFCLRRKGEKALQVWTNAPTPTQ